MANEKAKRNRLISLFVLLLIIIFLVYYFFYRDARIKAVQQALQSFSACDLNPITDTRVERQFDSVLSVVRAEVRRYETINLPGVFKPLRNCIIDSTACRDELGHIAMHVEGKHISIQLFDCEDVDGYVHLQSKTEFGLSRRLLDNIPQLRRTIIHELAHLATTEATHDSPKSECNYYKSIPIKCEYCLTGSADFTSKDTTKTLEINNIYQTSEVCFILAK
ncbi:MAG: hypothetical protein BGP13_08535 [Sphingobacteriales bacterium 40-81]|nr:MAG: hypothetical protein BGP13_08535 [Sphingobacteriales bacterium 40-81]